jgi:hypothetical protein
VKARAMIAAWVVIALGVLLGLGYEVREWRSIDAKRDRAGADRLVIESQIAEQEEEIRREERAHSDLLRDLQWSTNRGDPSAFLTGLADFAQGARLKITAVGPLERQAGTQFSKSWHTVQVVGPYREIKDLAARIEHEGGILEDVLLQVAPGGPGRTNDEIQAKWNLTVVELTPQAKAILQRTVASARPRGGAAFALPLPPAGLPPTATVRDPFAFVGTSPAPVTLAAAPARASWPGRPSAPAADGGTVEPVALAPLAVKGIVKFPGGNLAIVNQHIVQVGDVVDGHRVEEISETAVVVRTPQGGSRVLTLPALSASTPAPPRR